MNRQLQTRLPALLVLAWGCQCGEDALVDTRGRLTATPAAIDFGDVVVGSLRVETLQLSNTGAALYTFTSTALLPLRGEFALGAPIPRTLAPGQVLDLSLLYEPRDLGEDIGSLTLAGDDDQAATVIALRGVGVRVGAGLSVSGEACAGVPDSLSFGAARPGTTVDRTITVTSNGGAPLTVLSAVVEPGSSGEWTIDEAGLPRVLEPGATLTLTVHYTPADGGADQGAFVITTDDPARPSLRVATCGTGLAPAICARPMPLDLGAVAIGAAARGRLVLESCGAEPLTLSSVRTATATAFLSSAAFRLTSTPTAPLTLMPGATTEVEVEYTGALPYGPARAWVRVASDADGLPVAHFPVVARTASPCALFVAPTTLYFRGVTPGQSLARAAVIGNAGETTCAVASLAITRTSSVFAATSTAGFTLTPGEVRTVDVTYTPPDPGPHQGTLEVTDSGGAVYPVALYGNPPELPGCAVDVTPTVVSFGVRAVGSTTHLGLRVEAIGENACRVSAATLLNNNPRFTVTLPLLRTAFPGAGGVNVDVAFTPASAGAQSDVLRLDYAALGGGSAGSMQVAVAGTGADARICVTPPVVDFGAVAQGNSTTRAVVIESCGAAPLNLRGVIASGDPEFSVTQGPTIPQDIAPGANATPALRITYAPTSGGPHFGTVELLSSDPTQPVVPVQLSGNFAQGCDEVLRCAPATVTFGDSAVGVPKIVRVSCRSAGPAPVTIGSVTLAGNGPELAVSAQTPVTLGPGDTWTFDVRYTPVSTMAVTAMLSIGSNACLAPQALPVSGRGVEPVLPPCQPPSTFAPRVQWAWNASAVVPTHTNVWSTPLVANLDDDDGSGRIDENDIPDVIFISLDTYSVADPGGSIAGVLRVLSGDTGREKFSVTTPRFADTSIPAVGDLDGDGRPEIVGLKWIPTPMGTGMGGIFGRYNVGTLVALDNTGRLLWESDPWSWPPEISFNAAAPSLADLDGDGFSEIILGRDVFDHRGRLVWRGAADHGLAAAGPHSIVADIDLDGRPEVLAGGTAYRHDGSILWDISSVRDGGTAVGMLDPLDPFPQVVIHTGTSLVVIDHLAMQKWTASIPSMGPTTMLPVIADFDGDGDGDIAIADGEAMHVYAGTGGLLWSAPVSDSTCCAGISAFDFEGDGAYELILTDNGTAYVYRGADGTRIYRADRINPTAFEMPVVADIDNDLKAELLVALFGAPGVGGITAYSNVGDTWVAAPRIFNQQAYHVTNVLENGTIPRAEVPWPQGPRVFRGTVAACR